MKSKDFDFLFADSFDVLGTNRTYGAKLRGMDSSQYKETFRDDMVNVLTEAKGLLKVEPNAAQWLVGVNPFNFSSFSSKIFGDEETKRLILAEVANANVKDVMNFGSELHWLMWGTTGKKWANVKFDFKGEDRMALKDGQPYTDKEYNDATRVYEADDPSGKRKRISEPAFLGWLKYGVDDDYQRKMAEQILYRFTKAGDTVLVVDLHKDNVFIDVALQMGRFVAKVDSGIDFSSVNDVVLNKVKVKPVKPTNTYHSIKKKHLDIDEQVGVTVNTIENADAYDYLNKLNDKSINTLISDVPYNISMSNGNNGKGPYMNGKVGLDFGNWDMGQFHVEDFIDAVTPKIKDDGQVIIFNSFTNMETMAWKLKQNGFTVKGIFSWAKPNPVPHMPKLWPLNTFEQFIWAVKDDSHYTFNVRESVKEAKGGNAIEEGVFLFSPHEDLKHRFHTTQKPISLMKAIVSVFTNEGDVVLDSFMGSASTADASSQLKRYYVGSELDGTYFEKGTYRLKKKSMKPQPFIF